MAAVHQFHLEGDQVGPGEGLLGGTGVAHETTHLGVIGILADTRLLHDPARHRPVHVVAAQGGVAAGGQHREHALLQAQDGDVEGATTQVVDGDDTLGGAVQAVGHGGGGGFVEQAQHVQPRQGGGILGGLALGVVEVGGHGDHHPHQVAAQAGLGARLERLEDLRGDLHGTDISGHGVQARHAGIPRHEGIGQLVAQGLHVGHAAPHEALGRGDGIERVMHRAGQGLMPYPRFGTGAVLHYRGQQVAARVIGQGSGHAAAHRGHQGIGGAEVDPRRQPVLVRRGGLSRFGDLQ